MHTQRPALPTQQTGKRVPPRPSPLRDGELCWRGWEEQEGEKAPFPREEPERLHLVRTVGPLTSPLPFPLPQENN